MVKPKKPKRILSKRCTFILALFFSCSTTILLTLKYASVGSQEPFQVLDDGRITEFLVDTPGCRIPDWNPWDESIMPYFQPVHTYKCPGDLSFLVVKPNAVISLDDTLLQYYYEIKKESVHCSYQPITRAGNVEDFTADSQFKIGAERTLPFDVPLTDEFIKTRCTFPAAGKGENITFTEYLPLTPLKTKRGPVSHVDQSGHKRYNVILLGIDSVSSLNFQRHFPLTMKYLKEELSAITLKGYTKVGDNTFPNLVPLLTGYFYENFWNETANRTMYFDDVPFVWKEYAKAGYTTLFAEDAPDIATFNYYRSGFKKPPVDYYYRPFALAVENTNIRTRHCLGSKMEMEVVYDYLRSFVHTVNWPFFAFVFTARLTHDVFNDAGYADKPALNMIRTLHESGVLNDTLLVFYSDHGIRYTSVRKTFLGQFEERMPFMHLVFPKRFLEQHQRSAQNLRTNERRLTTPFDIHETLLDFLNITGTGADVAEESVLRYPGISLFSEVSPHRTCEHASISPHWCTCQVRKNVPIDEAMVTRAAKAIVYTINNWTKRLRLKCSPLILQKVHTARVSGASQTPEPSPHSTSKTSSHVDYLVVVSTMPGSGIFEATVRCNENNYCYVVDDISRINRYGDQSACINDSVLKKFCYCYFGTS